MRFDWTTADLHLDHVKISEYCPGRAALNARTPREMSEALIDRWNQVVEPEHDVLILGDLCMGKIADTLPLVEQMNGHKKLLLGNHDRPFGLYGSTVPKKQRQWERWSAEYENVGLQLITDGWFDMEVGGHKVRVCHFPYEGDSHGEDRYADQRPPDSGLVLLHGHVHDAWQIRDRQINVGADANGYYPVSEREIIRLIERVL